MKKADSFDAKQWLVENKITNQSRLNEEKTFNDNDKAYGILFVDNDDEEEIEYTPYVYNEKAIAALVKSMGYTNPNTVAGEFTNYTSPGDDDEMRIFRKQEGNPNLQPKDLTIRMYKKSIEKYKTLNRPVTLICNYNAEKDNFPFNVNTIIPFPDNCIEYWETNSDSFVDTLINQVGEKQNELFFISCGPVSEIIIHKLYSHNPNNTYIDVGSSIDEFVHGYKTRPYMDPSSQYYKMISKF